MEQLIQQMYGAHTTFIHNKQLGYQPTKEEMILQLNLSRALQAHARNMELAWLVINRKMEADYEASSGGNSPTAS